MRKIVCDIMDAFKVYNPELTVVKIFKFFTKYYVIALHDPTRQEMDPFYLYDPFRKKVYEFSYVRSFRLSGMIFKDRNCIYRDERFNGG